MEPVREKNSTRARDSSRSSSGSPSSSPQLSHSHRTDDGPHSTRSSQRRQQQQQYAKASRSSRRRYHEAHMPMYPHSAPAAPLLLDPLPNTHTRSACMVGDLLVTAHKTGLRVYREKKLEGAATAAAAAGGEASREVSGRSGSSPAAPPSALVSTGIWELKEVRDAYNLRDAYLTAAVQPVLRDHELVTTPYSRYFCVATGNDRTTHSVCVLSTGGHFNIHHELHGGNRVVALHFAQIAMEPFQPDRLTPLVLSVDEVGEMVLFNVVKETAVRLRRRDSGPDTIHEEDLEGLRGAGNVAATTAREEARILDEINFYEVVNKRNEASAMYGLRHPKKDARADSLAYRLEHGVATEAVLVGPCVELCNRCHNIFAQPTGTRNVKTGKSIEASGISPRPRFLALSIVVASRARDVFPSEDEPVSGEGKGDAHLIHSETVQQTIGGEAELGVTFLRVLCSPSSAYVWHEVDLVREVAPAEVCDAGVALYAPPYLVGHPMTVLVGRPRLRLWCLSGCTGQWLHTSRVYDEREGSDLGRRGAGEFFTRWLPLGPHALVHDTAQHTLWHCVAAVTDDDSILLLGRDPQAVAREAPQSVLHTCASTRAHPREWTGEPPEDDELVSTKLTAALSEGDMRHYEQRERKMLEAWLDEVEEADVNEEDDRSSAKANIHSATVATTSTQRKLIAENEGHESATARIDSAAAPIRTGSQELKEYTVLAVLYAPRRTLAAHHSHRPRGEGSDTSSRHSARSSSSSHTESTLQEDNSNCSLAGQTERSRRSHHRHRSSSIRGSDTTAVPSIARTPAKCGIKMIHADLARNALHVFLRDDKTILRVALPFTSAVQFPKDAEARKSGPRQGGGTDAAPTLAHKKSQPSEGAAAPEAPRAGSEAHVGGGLWASTRKALGAASTAGWLGFGGGASGPPSAAPLGSTAKAANPSGAEEEVSHGLNIVRPLAAAVFGWGGTTDNARERSPPPTAKSAPTTDSAPEEARTPEREGQDTPRSHARIAEGGTPGTAPSPSEANLARSPAPKPPVQPSGDTINKGPSMGTSPPQHSCHASLHSTTTTERASLPKRVEAVLINIDHPNRSSRRRRRDRPSNSHAAATPPASPTDQGHLQHLYMQEQVRQALAKESDQNTMTHRTPSPDAVRAARTQRVRAALRQVEQREEPAARNALLYEWQDAHDQLYIEFSLAKDAMTEAAERQHAAAAARAAWERELYLHPVSATEAVGSAHPRSLQDGGTSTWDTTCNVSAKFTQAYHALVDRRRRLCDRHGVFDFATYFATGTPPQQLIDLQERDKCQYELADLGLRQAAELAALDPVREVRLYQNEERRGGGRTGSPGAKTGAEGAGGSWGPHPTFPYDEEDGSVADIFAWNSTAGPQTPGQYVWDTSDGPEAATTTVAGSPNTSAATVFSPTAAAAAAAAGSPNSPVRVRALTRELRDWTLGSWEYAARWPSAEESRRGTFVWSTQEEPTSVVRRRPLTRRRIHVKTQAAREKLIAEHQQQLDVLRQELDL